MRNANKRIEDKRRREMAGLTKLDHVTLAIGEVTNHSHRAIGGTLYKASGGALVLDRTAETTVQHEEHGSFVLPESPATNDLFDVRQVQEFDHAAKAARNAAD